jgi:hypothetical protein
LAEYWPVSHIRIPENNDLPFLLVPTGDDGNSCTDVGGILEKM